VVNAVAGSAPLDGADASAAIASAVDPSTISGPIASAAASMQTKLLASRTDDEVGTEAGGVAACAEGFADVGAPISEAVVDVTPWLRAGDNRGVPLRETGVSGTPCPGATLALLSLRPEVGS